MTLNDRFKMSFRDNDEVKVEGKTLLLEDSQFYYSGSVSFIILNEKERSIPFNKSRSQGHSLRHILGAVLLHLKDILKETADV